LAEEPRGRSQSFVATYTFGDDGAALDRLELVAAAYAPVSRRFLVDHASRGAGMALDLGCGPGFSTRLLDEACAPRALVGIDSSSDFVEMARARVPGAGFETHDVTSMPLPHAPADIIYARLLLAHLGDPVGTVESWRSQLAPGGVLLIEDLEGIDAPGGPLRTYDEISSTVVRQAGGPMYAGALLAPLGGRCIPVTVSASTAARIYLFNVRRWIDDPTVAVPEVRLRQVEQELSALVDVDGGDTVSWIVRQVALPA
jgi:trans-aconitate 2-methyltransferase